MHGLKAGLVTALLCVLATAAGIWWERYCADSSLKMPPSGRNAAESPADPLEASLDESSPANASGEPQSVAVESLPLGLASPGTWRPEHVGGAAEQAARMIRHGRLPDAALLLRRAIEDSGRPTPRELFMLAVCEETLGDDREAFRHYSQVVDLSSTPNTRVSASLGQSRLLIRYGDAPTAVTLLSRELLKSGELGDGVRARLWHQWAAAMTRSEWPSAAAPLSPACTPIGVPEIVPEAILDELESPAPTIAEAAPFVRETLRLDPSAESIFLNADHPSGSIWDFLQILAAATGCEFAVDAPIVAALESRTITARCDGFSLATLLDVVLVPELVSWRQEGNRIIIEGQAAQSPGADFVRERRARAVRLALSAAPEHPLAVWTALEAALEVASRTPSAESARAFKDLIERFPVGPHLHEAWFQLGKCQSRTASEEALISFQRAADLAGSGTIAAVANWCVGRMLMRNGKDREALLPLTHAVALATGRPEQHELQLTLAAARLTTGDIPGARQSLFAVPRLDDGSVLAWERRFLEQLIRVRESTRSHQKEQEAAALLPELVALDPQGPDSEQWLLLACTAWSDLGFPEEAERLVPAVRERFGTFPRLVQTETSLARRRPDGAGSGSPSVPGSNDRLRNLDGIADRGPDEARSLCRVILSDPAATPEERLAALRVLGRLAQRTGDHRTAVQYLSGHVAPRPTDPNSKAKAADPAPRPFPDLP